MILQVDRSGAVDDWRGGEKTAWVPKERDNRGGGRDGGGRDGGGRNDRNDRDGESKSSESEF